MCWRRKVDIVIESASEEVALHQWQWALHIHETDFSGNISNTPKLPISNNISEQKRIAVRKEQIQGSRAEAEVCGSLFDGERRDFWHSSTVRQRSVCATEQNGANAAKGRVGRCHRRRLATIGWIFDTAAPLSASLSQRQMWNLRFFDYANHSSKHCRCLTMTTLRDHEFTSSTGKF